MTEEQKEKIKAIKAWALQNYCEGGSWIIETYTDNEIDEEFETLGDAMKYCMLMKECEEEYRDA
jgi:hypothetical protein